MASPTIWSVRWTMRASIWLHPIKAWHTVQRCLERLCISGRIQSTCRLVVSLSFFKVTRIMGHEDFPTFWTTAFFFEAMKSADLPLGQAISSWWTQRRMGFKSSTKMTMAGTRPRFGKMVVQVADETDWVFFWVMVDENYNCTSILWQLIRQLIWQAINYKLVTGFPITPIYGNFIGNPVIKMSGFWEEDTSGRGRSWWRRTRPGTLKPWVGMGNSFQNWRNHGCIMLLPWAYHGGIL